MTCKDWAAERDRQTILKLKHQQQQQQQFIIFTAFTNLFCTAHEKCSNCVSVAAMSFAINWVSLSDFQILRGTKTKTVLPG